MRRIVLYISIVVLMAVACSPAVTTTPVVEGDVSIAYLRSLADERSQRIKSDVWIEGDVVLNDKLDESYRSIVLYDGTSGIELKIDIDSLDDVIPLFSHLRIRCEGLYIGREGARVVLGAKPTSEYVVDRISEAEFENRIAIIEDWSDRPKSRSLAVCDIDNSLVSSYVRVEGVWLISEELGLMWCDDDCSARPFDSSLRHFTQGVDTLTVATLNRCDYATDLIPSGVISMIGVVDSYEGGVVLRLSNRTVIE